MKALRPLAGPASLVSCCIAFAGVLAASGPAAAQEGQGAWSGVLEVVEHVGSGCDRIPLPDRIRVEATGNAADGYFVWGDMQTARIVPKAGGRPGEFELRMAGSRTADGKFILRAPPGAVQGDWLEDATAGADGGCAFTRARLALVRAEREKAAAIEASAAFLKLLHRALDKLNAATSDREAREAALALTLLGEQLPGEGVADPAMAQVFAEAASHTSLVTAMTLWRSLLESASALYRRTALAQLRQGETAAAKRSLEDATRIDEELRGRPFPRT